MKRLVCLFVSALLGCEVASHVAPDTQPGGSEAVQNQGSVDETSADQNGPAPVPKKPGPGVPTPKPTPPPAQPDAGASSDNAPDTEADAAATDEEEFEGCGPMGEEPVTCEWNYDCPPYDVSWMTNACVQGACVQDEVTAGFDYDHEGVDTSKLCVAIYRLRADGWWHSDQHKLPYSVPLEALCKSLEKNAYVSPQIADVVLQNTKRIEFAIVWCAGPQEENLYYKLPFSGFDIKVLPEYTKHNFKVGFKTSPLDNFTSSYIKGLGALCHLYNHPNPSDSIYLWD